MHSFAVEKFFWPTCLLLSAVEFQEDNVVNIDY